MNENELKAKWYDLTQEREALVKTSNERINEINQELEQINLELNPTVTPVEG